MKTYTKQTPIGEITAFANDSFAHQMQSKGYYAEQEILDSHLKEIIEKCDIILDIGGHVGYHSVAYCGYNPKAKIKCYEPQSQVFELLKKNLDRNGFSDRVEPFNVAVGDKVRKTSLLGHVTDGSNSGINVEFGTSNTFNLGGRQLGVGVENIDMITIDSLELDALDYIKIDVEGAETLVLMGGEYTIKKFKPIICFEFNDFKKLSPEYLKELGYDSILTPRELLESWGYTKFEGIKYENFIATWGK